MNMKPFFPAYLLFICLLYPSCQPESDLTEEAEPIVIHPDSARTVPGEQIFDNVRFINLGMWMETLSVKSIWFSRLMNSSFWSIDKMWLFTDTNRMVPSCSN